MNGFPAEKAQVLVFELPDKSAAGQDGLARLPVFMDQARRQRARGHAVGTSQLDVEQPAGALGPGQDEPDAVPGQLADRDRPRRPFVTAYQPAHGTTRGRITRTGAAIYI